MLTLKKAQTILKAALAAGRDKQMRPLAVVVLDARGTIKVAAAEDNTSISRMDIAVGKASGALSLGMGSRQIEKMAKERPHFISAAVHAVGGRMVPVAGGVLVRDAKGLIIGVVGVSGDTSDNDELAAAEGIKAAGLTPDGGIG